MAVRDQEPDGRHAPTGWRDALGQISSLLAAGAVLLYAYLSLAYDRFYHGLGLDPSDVGLTYAGVLARSAGFVTFCLIVLVQVAPYPLWAWLEHRAGLRQKRGHLSSAGIVGTVLIMALLLLGPFPAAERAASHVKSGKPVDAIEFPGSYAPDPPSFFQRLVVLAVHADPAAVEPIGKPDDAPAAARLQGRKLLYLGQADSTVVLYDPTAQEAVYLPAGSVILRVSNCATKRSLDPA